MPKNNMRRRHGKIVRYLPQYKRKPKSIRRDRGRRALRPGLRISRNKKRYVERRQNRSDFRPNRFF